MKNVFRIFYNSILFRTSNKTLIYTVLFLSVIVLSVISNFFILNKIRNAVNDDAYIIYSYFFEIFQIILILTAFLSTLIKSFEIFFYDRELLFLYSLPLSKKTVFFNGFLKLWLYGSALYLTFSVSSAAVITFFFKTNFLFFVIESLAFILTSLIYVSVALIAVFLCTKLLKDLSEKIITFLSVFSLSFFVIILRYVRPEKILNSDFSKIKDILKTPLLNYFPSYFTKKIFISFYKNEIPLKYFFILFIIASFSLYIAYLLYDKKFMFSFIGKRKKHGKILKVAKNVKKALGEKNIAVFLRNHANINQITLFIGLIIVFSFNVIFLKQNKGFELFTAFFNFGIIFLINASFISRIFFTDDKTKSEIYFLKSLPLDYEKLAFSKKFGFSKILSVFSVIFLIPIILSLPNKNFYFACFILIIDLLVLNDFLLTSASYLILKNINEKFSMFSPTTLKYVIFSVAVSFFVIFTQYVYFQFSSLNLWVSKNSIFIATSPIIITFTLSKILKKKSIKLIKLI